MASPPASPASPGGFLVESPPASPSPAPAAMAPPPVPRRSPLSLAKQQKLITYLDEQLLLISRRHIRHFSGAAADGDVYHSLVPLVHDLERVVDLTWYSAHPRGRGDDDATGAGAGLLPFPFLQTQYLLRIADEVNTYLSSLPLYDDEHPPGARAHPIFALLAKLDGIFFSLVTGEAAGADGPAAAVAVRMGPTERVRLEGIIERTRIDIVNVFLERWRGKRKRGRVAYDESETETEDLDASDVAERHEVGRVYQATLNELS
ncbi:uncharacterized protein V1510DRAFT_410574, partial [Dipodascopsis tothii]|uniref:uncharacterized protein n=1 Tax=Dipodascopsis tothii TaxID=44089 RepID=UPI0034CF3E6A